MPLLQADCSAARVASRPPAPTLIYFAAGPCNFQLFFLFFFVSFAYFSRSNLQPAPFVLSLSFFSPLHGKECDFSRRPPYAQTPYLCYTPRSQPHRRHLVMTPRNEHSVSLVSFFLNSFLPNNSIDLDFVIFFSYRCFDM